MPGDVRRKYTPDGKVVEVRNFSNKCNGMTYDADLNLLVCEHVTSSLVRESPDGSREIIAQEFEGEELNSPNDVCVHSSGAIYFSDPWYGRFPGFGHPRKRRLGFQGVYRIAPGGGDLELIVGRGRVRDAERHLLLARTSRSSTSTTRRGRTSRSTTRTRDGNISNGRMFFEGVGSGVIEEGIPDGMKCDERGNIWVTGPGRDLGHLRRRRAPRDGPRPREHREPHVGRRRLAHALHPELDLALRDPNHRRPAPRALHALGGEDERRRPDPGCRRAAC